MVLWVRRKAGEEERREIKVPLDKHCLLNMTAQEFAATSASIVLRNHPIPPNRDESNDWSRKGNATDARPSHECPHADQIGNLECCEHCNQANFQGANARGKSRGVLCMLPILEWYAGLNTLLGQSATRKPALSFPQLCTFEWLQLATTSYSWFCDMSGPSPIEYQPKAYPLQSWKGQFPCRMRERVQGPMHGAWGQWTSSKSCMRIFIATRDQASGTHPTTRQDIHKSRWHQTTLLGCLVHAIT